MSKVLLFKDASSRQSIEIQEHDKVPQSVDENTTSLEVEADLQMSEQTSVQYLGIAPLSMLVFFTVSGGPFGIEESVRSAGFFVSIMGFILMPLVWSLPEALITAELGTTYPDASGGVAWIEEAFGSRLGWQAGFLGWVAGAVDNAIYPVLFLDYVFQLWGTSSDEQVSPFIRFILVSSTTLLLGYFNWLGLHVVGKMTIIIGALSISPFVIMVALGISKVDTSHWFQLLKQNEQGVLKETSSTQLLGPVLWRPLLNNLFWNLNSYDSTASYSGEVRDPGYVLPRALFYGGMITSLGYVLSLLIAIGATDSAPSDWVDGYLATSAELIGGKWLGAWMVFAAGIANIATFQAELSGNAFQLMGMAERGFVPKIFATRSTHGTPTYAILLGVCVIIATGSINLEGLIEMLNWNYAIKVLMEYAAFLKLRISKPDVLRPFRVPLGTCSCLVLVAPAMLGVLAIMGLASWSSIFFSATVNLTGMLLYAFQREYCCMACGKYRIIDQATGDTTDLAIGDS